jgi:hypothetical protein
MELLFGTNVREYGQHVGRLAGFEVDPATRRIRAVVFSGDGESGSHATARPFDSVLIEPGDIEIRPYTSTGDPSRGAGILLNHATRVVRSGREIGRLIGVDVGIAGGELEAVVGRKNWLTRRFRCEVADVDLSVPGEVRVGGTATRAA